MTAEKSAGGGSPSKSRNKRQGYEAMNKSLQMAMIEARGLFLKTKKVFKKFGPKRSSGKEDLPPLIF